jgi:phage terminase large subunit-like protein
VKTDSAVKKQFQTLSPEDQQAVAERLLRVKNSGWRPFWCKFSTCPGSRYLEDDEGNRLGEHPRWPHDDDPAWQHNHARPDQRLLPWSKPWVLYLSSGRGTGKTETGSQFIHHNHRKGVDTLILGRRGTELVNTHVKRIMETAHPEFMPEYFASKDILVWPNGTTTYLFSAEKPENIRSINVGAAWVDEGAFMAEIETAWMNLKLATRIETPGNPIHILVTSTPTSTPWVMMMEDDEDVTMRRVSTYANKANLSADYIKDMKKRYEGTRMGRQELHGEVLRDVEGAFWNDDMYVHEHVGAVEFQNLLDAMDDRVLAVDPAGSKGPRSDATGIIGCGAIHSGDGQFYVLADGTLKGSPAEWAERVYKTARLIRANRIIVEKNFGGDMVRQTLKDWAKLHPAEGKDENGEEYRILLEHAVLSKETRAEPTVGKYEQHRVTHVVSPTAYGDLSALEVEQTMWVPKSRGGKFPSPNRVDALVWAIKNLEKGIKYGTAMATQRDALKALKKRNFGR